MLLNNNCHPFGCINGIASSASLSTIPQNIVNGYCPFVDQDEDNFPLETLEMNVFPAEIQHLFSRAFGYNSENATSLSVISNRPSANEWRVALGNLYQSDMIVCPRNHLHEYPKSLDRGPGGCPWCAMERRIGIRMR